MIQLTEQEQKDIDSFVWNDKVTPEKIERMNKMRESGANLCRLMIEIVPNTADRSAAIRCLRLAVMQCNLAIAHEAAK